MDVIVHSDDVGQRCLFFLTDVDIPTVLGVSFLGEEIIVGISYLGVVAYQFKKTFEFLYLVVSYGGFGLVRVNQQIVDRRVMFAWLLWLPAPWFLSSFASYNSCLFWKNHSGK